MKEPSFLEDLRSLPDPKTGGGEGKYKNNYRIGIWETFDKKGNLLLSEKYSK